MIKGIESDFPILSQKVNGKKLVYLDNAATTQKPKAVIKSIERYYNESNANIHRGVHALSQKATDLYENSRKNISNFINAESEKQIIFVRGATEAINLVANSHVRPLLNQNDEIIISQMEHHANIVPWQLICEERNAKLRILPMNQRGELILDSLGKIISKKTKFMAINHVSNSLGTVNPIEEIVKIAHQHKIKILIDGAQAVQHIPIDIQKIGADFYCFSGHKLYGPTGIGILYGKKQLLNEMPPYQGGGDMIKSVTFDETVYNDVPHKFEAGTPNISGAIGLSTAIDYIREIGIEKISKHESELLEYASKELNKIDKIISQINILQKDIEVLEDDQFPKKTIELREKIKNGISLDVVLPEAFAIVREASNRVRSEKHYDVLFFGCGMCWFVILAEGCGV